MPIGRDNSATRFERHQPGRCERARRKVRSGARQAEGARDLDPCCRSQGRNQRPSVARAGVARETGKRFATSPQATLKATQLLYFMAGSAGPLYEQRRGPFFDVEIQSECGAWHDCGSRRQPAQGSRREGQIKRPSARRLGRHIVTQRPTWQRQDMLLARSLDKGGIVAEPVDRTNHWCDRGERVAGRQVGKPERVRQRSRRAGWW